MFENVFPLGELPEKLPVLLVVGLGSEHARVRLVPDEIVVPQITPIGFLRLGFH